MGQPPIPAVPASTSLAGKTVVVTGANAGMGLEAARQFLALGASRLVLAVRTISKGTEAATYLSAEASGTGNPHAEISVMKLDLDDYASVHAFSEQVRAQLDTLDILLLNGGVNIMSYQVSRNNHERVMQVNYYSNAMLALELLPLLKATAARPGKPSRITFVGSMGQNMHTLGKKPLANEETLVGQFDDKSKYVGLQRYSDSKLPAPAFVQELARRLSPDEIIVNNVCPGLVATGFDANLPTWLKPIMFVMRKFKARTVEEGSRALINASAVFNNESHGQLIADNKIVE